MREHVRLPAAPLLARLQGSRQERAAALGYASTSNLAKLNKRGLTIWEADRLAVRIGLHPIEVWGDDYLKETA